MVLLWWWWLRIRILVLLLVLLRIVLLRMLLVLGICWLSWNLVLTRIIRLLGLLLLLRLNNKTWTVLRVLGHALVYPKIPKSPQKMNKERGIAGYKQATVLGLRASRK
jgi:hypothetical protein